MTRASAGAGVVCRQHEEWRAIRLPLKRAPTQGLPGSQVQCLFPQVPHQPRAMDFTQTPPGMLALDNMLATWRKSTRTTYIRARARGPSYPRRRRRLPPLSLHPPLSSPQIVLENSSREDKHECLWPQRNRAHQDAV